MFASTQRFQAAVGLINRVPPERHTQVLHRITKKLHLKTDKAFTEAEEQQLGEMLELNSADVKTLVDVSSFIFLQAAYHTTKPKALLSELTTAGVQQAQAEVYAVVWRESGEGVVGKLKEFTLGGPDVLTGVNWRLHMQLGQSTMSEMTEPRAIFEFSTANAQGGEENDPFVVEFSQEQLYSFFEKLETIQSQMDSLA